MANIVNIQTIIDGPRNTVIKIVGILDTSDLATTVLADPALLSGIDNTGAVKAQRLRVKNLLYNVEDGLAIYLNWDATVPVLLEQMTGRGNLCFDHFGGLPNNAAAPGNLGVITIATQGWAALSTLSFSLVIELIKQQNP